jgi:hypothetical protein
MKKFLIILGLSIIWTASAFAQSNEAASPPLQTITLKDGSVLKGHLSAVSGDHYTVETANMGEVQVPVAKVSSITTGSQPAGQVPSASGNNQMPVMNNPLAGQSQFGGNVSQAQQQILKDPEIMGEIQTMLTDPDLVKLLQDKSVMQDIMSMDQTKIQNNPNIQALMDNPKMQAILTKLMGKMGGSNGSAPSAQPTAP